MRNMFVTLVLLAGMAIFESCKKDSTLTENALVQGTWELTTLIGGIAGQHIEYPAGNGNKYIFVTNSYEIYVNSQLSKKGNFSLIRDTSYSVPKMVTRIVFDNIMNGVRTFVEFKNSTMTITEDVSDGFTYVYRKI